MTGLGRGLLRVLFELPRDLGLKICQLADPGHKRLEAAYWSTMI